MSVALKVIERADKKIDVQEYNFLDEGSNKYTFVASMKVSSYMVDDEKRDFKSEEYEKIIRDLLKDRIEEKIEKDFVNSIYSFLESRMKIEVIYDRYMEPYRICSLIEKYRINEIK